MLYKKKGGKIILEVVSLIGKQIDLYILFFEYMKCVQIAQKPGYIISITSCDMTMNNLMWWIPVVQRKVQS